MFHVNLADSNEFGIDTARTSEFIDWGGIKNGHGEKIQVNLFLFLALSYINWAPRIYLCN